MDIISTMPKGDRSVPVEFKRRKDCKQLTDCFVSGELFATIIGRRKMAKQHKWAVVNGKEITVVEADIRLRYECGFSNNFDIVLYDEHGEMVTFWCHDYEGAKDMVRFDASRLTNKEVS